LPPSLLSFSALLPSRLHRGAIFPLTFLLPYAFLRWTRRSVSCSVVRSASLCLPPPLLSSPLGGDLRPSEVLQAASCATFLVTLYINFIRHFFFVLFLLEHSGPFTQWRVPTRNFLLSPVLFTPDLSFFDPPHAALVSCFSYSPPCISAPSTDPGQATQ